MPTPRKLPEVRTLVRMRNKGMTLKEIGDLYDTTEGGVWAALNEAGETTERHTYKEVIPYEIDERHRYLQIMEQFRRMNKLLRGGKLTDVDRRRLTKWLTAMKEDNVVVCYHPEAPAKGNALSPVKGGFYYADREDSDQDHVIRAPEGATTTPLSIDSMLSKLHDLSWG